MKAPRTPTRLREVTLPEEGVFLAVEGVSAEALAGILRAHRENRDPARSLKRNLGTVVTRVTLERGTGAEASGIPVDLVVKEVPVRLLRRWFYRLGGSSPFHREFEMVRRLGELGVRVPCAVACSVRPSGNRAFLITELITGAVPLRDLLWLGDRVLRDREELGTLFSNVGVWLRSVHDLGVWQRDMKPSNVLVRGLGSRDPELFLVDLTAVRILGRPVGKTRRIRNLAQLLDLTSDLDGPPRLPLLRAYIGPDTPAIDRWSRLVSEAIEARRDYRERQCGCRYVDEEHARNASRQE